MKDVIGELAIVVQNPLQRARRWKEAGKGVIGCFPMYVPEEIIHASGMLPIILPGSDESIVLANKYLQPYLCHPVRSNFELALKGELDFLDGIVFPDICDQTQCLADIWGLHFSVPVHHLVVPSRIDASSSKDYLKRGFSKLRAFVEGCSGQVSNEALWHSIEIYNQERSLLQKLYSRRRNNATWLSARDVAVVVASSLLMPKEEHISLLTQLIEQGKASSLPTEDKVRLLLSGNLCDTPEKEILSLIEELGGIVVDDDLYVGRRYFATFVPGSAGDPLEALAEHYINDLPCPMKHHPGKDWADYLIQLAQESQADGILVMMMKYCEPHALDYPYLKEKFSAVDIPHLLLETEHTGASGQVRTRLQAFIEGIRSEKHGS